MSIGKILITTGMTPGGFHKKTDPNEIHNEIIDLMNINAICDPVPDFPIEISYATGGLLKDRMPIGAIHKLR